MTQRREMLVIVGVSLLVTTALGLISSAQHYASMIALHNPMPWRHAAVMELPFWYASALLTPFVVWAVRRFPGRSTGPLTRSAAHIAIGLTWIVAETVLEIATHVALGTGLPGPRPSFLAEVGGSLFWSFPVRVVAYLGILGAIYAMTYYARYREQTIAAAQLETRLAETRLQLLRMQLNPHFLFNAMNAIVVLTRAGRSAEAVSALLTLSGLMREVLRNDSAHVVSLEEELDFITRYIRIEQVRFGGQLLFDMDVPPELLHTSVPNFVLQPLVENAIRHGRAPSDGTGKVRISATRENGSLTLSVWDDGNGPVPASDAPSSGLGLRNTRERLAQMYGGSQSFELRRATGGGTVAEITIPFSIERSTQLPPT